jgi:HEAT repeat protein
VAKGDAVEVLGQLVRNLDMDGPATAAIYAIAQIGTEESARELAGLLIDRQGTAVEADLVKAIGRIKLPEMVEALAVHLGPESPADLRLLAVRALGLTRQDAAVAPLKSILAESGDMTLKGTALEALSRVGSREAVDELIRLHRENGELAFAAGLAIGNVEGEAAVKPLLDAYDDLEDNRVKVRWVEALGNSGSDSAVPKLREILESGEEAGDIRGRAAVSLARLGDSESVAPIVSMLENTRKGDANLVIQITDALRKMALHRDAQPALLEKALPVLRKMTAKPSQNVEYYYAEQAKRVIENLAMPRDRK